MFDKKGFTLLELLIVLLIICILISIALPHYTATLEKAKSAEAIINIGAIRVALDRYWYQNASLPANNDFSGLDIDNPNSVTNKLFVYSFRDNGTTGDTRKYTVTALRLNNPDIWVKWNQLNNMTGKLTRSANLGGPTS